MRRRRCAPSRPGRIQRLPTRPVRRVAAADRLHVPYTVEQDEDGVWCAHAQLRPGVGANGEGDTAEAAVADLREALTGADAGLTGAELQRLL